MRDSCALKPSLHKVDLLRLAAQQSVLVVKHDHLYLAR